eukprot:945679-Prymnesium_polylepis.2
MSDTRGQSSHRGRIETPSGGQHATGVEGAPQVKHASPSLVRSRSRVTSRIGSEDRAQSAPALAAHEMVR